MPVASSFAVLYGSTALVLKLLYWKNRVNSAVVGAVISSSTALAIVMFFVTTL